MIKSILSQNANACERKLRSNNSDRLEKGTNDLPGGYMIINSC